MNDSANTRPDLTEALTRWLLTGLISLVVLWAGLLDLLPPTERDALIHHLAIPKMWLRAGGLVEIPWTLFSYYPMNIELLYWAALTLGSDVAANFIHHGFGLATALLIYVYLRPRLSRNWALLGVLIFLSTPMVMRLSASANVDLGLTFFITLCLGGLLYWHNTGRGRYFILSAAALGLALGTKYNALVALPFLGLGVILIRSRSGDGPVRSILWSCAYVGIALLVFSPWAVKNLIVTGNPMYPLFNGAFGLPVLTPDDMNFSQFALRQQLYGESFLEIVTTPLRGFFMGQDFSGKFFDGVLNPILLLAPIPAILRPRRPEIRPLAAFAWIWILVVFFQAHFIVRYFLPALPILAALAVFGLREFHDWAQRKVSTRLAGLLLAAVTALFLWSNAAWAYNYWNIMNPNGYLTGRQSRSEYLRRNHPPFAAIEYINSQARPEARVLLLFGWDRGYYLDREYFYYPYFSGEILRPYIDRIRTVDDLRAAFVDLGADYVLTQEKLLVGWVNEAWPKETIRVWPEMSAKGWKKVFEANGFSVYKINRD